MFLKFRYRLGYESLCREVADSISWQRFCRIPLGTRVPHPTTLMKITTRCGDDGGRRAERGAAGQSGRGEAAAHRQGARRHHGGGGRRGLSDRFGSVGQGDRHDGAHVGRIKAAGGATRTRSRDRRRSAGRRARSIAAKLRLRGAEQRDEAQAAVRRITGELAGIAEAAMREARRGDAQRHAGRCAPRRATQRPAAPGGQRPGHACGTHRRVVAQTRSRLAGVMPNRRPAGQLP